MKYSVGYQLMKSTDYITYIVENKNRIKEVYFSWGDIPNGRSTMLNNNIFMPLEAQNRQLEDLKKVSNSGIILNLLLNANCYGKYSKSRVFYNKLGNSIDYLKSHLNLCSITTTSPIIAKFVKNNFGELEIKASINMEIRSVQGMVYLSEYFDSFYMKREYNRNLYQIKKLKKWCEKNGKKLYMLANSGCFNDCPAHTFHDNLVAHENEIIAMDNAYEFKGVCWEYLSEVQNRKTLLRDTNFVRPENIGLYEKYFDTVKLATRVNSYPIRVVNSYIKEKYSGSILDLLEPNHSGALYPYLLENSKIPKDFGEKVLKCDKNCEKCRYCIEVYNNALIKLE